MGGERCRVLMPRVANNISQLGGFARMTIKALQFNISDSSLRNPPSNPISGVSPDFDRQRTLTRPSME